MVSLPAIRGASKLDPWMRTDAQGQRLAFGQFSSFDSLSDALALDQIAPPSPLTAAPAKRRPSSYLERLAAQGDREPAGARGLSLRAVRRAIRQSASGTSSGRGASARAAPRAAKTGVVGHEHVASSGGYPSGGYPFPSAAAAPARSVQPTPAARQAQGASQQIASAARESRRFRGRADSVSPA